MKKLRNLIAVMAMMSMAAVLTGCGDDDDDDDDDGGPQGPVIVAPADVAALTAQNLVYTVTVAGQNDPITLTFPSAGNYQMVQAGVTETGTIDAATRTDNTWTLNVIPAAGQAGAQEGVLRLDFSAANAGTWTFTPTGGQAESGTFTVTTSGGGDPGGDGGDNGGGSGDAPASLDGRRIQIATTGFGQELLTFSGATSGTFTSDINEGAGGTFTYTPTENTAVLNLEFDTPAPFANDFYNLTLTFTSDTAGTFSGNQHYEGADHNTTGNFSLP